MKDPLARFILNDADFAAIRSAERDRQAAARNQPTARMAYSVVDRGGMLTAKLPSLPDVPRKTPHLSKASSGA